MGRAPCCDKANVKKGPWSPEEDAKLKNFIETNGTGGNWITLPSKAGLKRCGKSCRLRWINYLRPDIKHGSFTEDEERIIYHLHASIGSRWSLIAAQLPGRTDNDIKNYWNTRLKKKLAERGMNAHHQQRNYHMQNIQNLAAQFPGLSSAAADGLLQQMLQPQMVQYYQQQQYNSAPHVSQQATLPQYSHQQQLQQQQMLVVKNELMNSRDVVNVGIDERLMMIESSLRSCIPTPLVPNGSMTSVSTVSAHQSSAPMSPACVEVSRQPSPSSSCSGISSDRSYGGQLAESAYSDGFSNCNSYEDPARLSDAHSNALLSVTDVLPLESRQPSNARSSQKVHTGTAAAITPERFGLEPDEILESYQTSVLPEPSVERLVKEELKEEMSNDWWSGLISPRTPRSSMFNKWLIPSPRCGAENVFSGQHQAQTPSTPALDAFADQFMLKNNYVAI